MENEKIMITGGAGFLGSHLCDRLIKRGEDVLCIDNFFTSSKWNISYPFGHPFLELMHHDVTFPLYVEVDQIFNLACPASPTHYQFDPEQTTKASVHGTINILGLAKQVKPRILQASTSEVCGDPEVHPQTEDYWERVNLIGIHSCYGEDKRYTETLLFDEGGHKGIESHHHLALQHYHGDASARQMLGFAAESLEIRETW